MLLALLLLYPNRALPKGEAATLLWGDGASEANLNKAISLRSNTESDSQNAFVLAVVLRPPFSV